MKKNLNGFTLVEMMLTLAIIIGLLIFGLPTFLQYLVNERRLEAAGILSKLAIAMEKYQLENNTYAGATLEKLNFPTLIVKDHYHLIIQYATDKDFLILATPRGSQAEKDKQCETLTLRATGEKGITGTGNVSDCW